MLAISACVVACGSVRRSAPEQTGDAGPGPDDAGPDSRFLEHPIGRPVPEVCETARGPGSPFESCAGAPEGECCCESDEQCTDGENGRCVRDHSVQLCDYDECVSDGDCPEGTVCACDAGVYGADSCVPAECVTDADCGPFVCSLAYACGGATGRNGGAAYRCHTPLDECGTDEDCDSQTFCTRGASTPSGWVEDRWTCASICAIGPPLCH